MKNSFEEDLKKLEDIGSKLESNDLTLDEAISIYEEGIKLSKKCSDKLNEAEKKINILIEQDGNVKEEKFD